MHVFVVELRSVEGDTIMQCGPGYRALAEAHEYAVNLLDSRMYDIMQGLLTCDAVLVIKRQPVPDAIRLAA